MKNRNIQKLIAVILALGLPVLATTIDSTLTISIPTATGFGAKGATNYAVGTTATYVDVGSTHDKEFSSHARLWGKVTVGAAATTNGVVRLYYSISADATIFTTDNTDRYIEIDLTKADAPINSVPIDLHGIKQIAYGGYANTSTTNAFTNAVMWVSYGKE